MKARDASAFVPLALAFVTAIAAASPGFRPLAATTASASASASVAPPPPDVGYAPDPSPTVTKRKWLYEVIFHEGALFVPTPVAVEKPRPTETPRRMGRFAIELWVGKTLLDRVRFDVPLTNGDPWSGEKRPRDAPPDFERHLHAKTTVEVPDVPRATYAILVDRATRRRIPIPWPPTMPPPATSASSSPSAAPSTPKAAPG